MRCEKESIQRHHSSDRTISMFGISSGVGADEIVVSKGMTCV